jgi:hypothetical protein
LQSQNFWSKKDIENTGVENLSSYSLKVIPMDIHEDKNEIKALVINQRMEFLFKKFSKIVADGRKEKPLFTDL